MSLKNEIRKVLKRHPRTRAMLADWNDRHYIRKRNREMPGLKWQLGPRAPEASVEASRCQIGHELFVFGGYKTLGEVLNRVDVLDLQKNQWTRRSRMPANAPQTHNGTTTDGQETIFLISGQLGGNCSPVSSKCFAFNSRTMQWSDLPPLPEGRYMPLVHHRNGRIHCLSGSRPDRKSPASDHWSIGVGKGMAIESHWRVEASLPSPRTHTASHLIDDTLYVFGGQQGDVPPIAGAIDYACNFNTEADILFDETYAFNLETNRRTDLAPMPEKISHTEHAVLQFGSKILIAGGVLNRHTMNDLMLAYDVATDRWETIGRLPYPMKSKIAAYWQGWLYIVTGQKSVSITDLRPMQVLDTVWRAKLPVTLKPDIQQ